jgi:hypothetical protein
MNIIFLDIDGVMKPARCYLDDKKHGADGGFDELSVAAVNKLAEKCNAGVVFNTTWNARWKTMDDVQSFAKDMGLTCEIAGKTLYPSMDSRLAAIHHWIGLSDQKNINWVALDDYEIASTRAVLVDAQVGITVDDYIKATEILGNRDPFIILM